MPKRNTLAAANAARRDRYKIRTTSYQMKGLRRGKSGKVRRDSYQAGEREAREWRRHNIFSATERAKRLVAIAEANRRTKAAGKVCGDLKYRDLEILDCLMGVRCFRTGACEPALREVASMVRVCVQTVCDAIKRLVAFGVLGKVRRTRPIESPEPDGPQVEQIPNAYWFPLPAKIAERVRAFLSPGGKPVDQEQREQDEAALVAAMIASLSAEDLARLHAGDNSILAAALAACGRAHDERSTAIL